MYSFMRMIKKTLARKDFDFYTGGVVSLFFAKPLHPLTSAIIIIEKQTAYLLFEERLCVLKDTRESSTEHAHKILINFYELAKIMSNLNPMW